MWEGSIYADKTLPFGLRSAPKKFSALADALEWILRANLKGMVTDWLQRKKATKRQLLSLIGHLGHAAKVVTPGRAFIRRRIDPAHSRRELHHWMYLNAEFKSDLQWWNLFLDRWNGKSCLAVHISAPAEERWRPMRQVPGGVARFVVTSDDNWHGLGTGQSSQSRSRSWGPLYWPSQYGEKLGPGSVYWQNAITWQWGMF